MTVCHVDFETRSAVDLKKTGVHVYAADPSTDAWCMAYAFDDEPVEVWTLGEPLPRRVAAHVRMGGRLVAHNAAFERAVWHHVCTPRYGWPEPTLEQWQCTMVMAAAMSLPQSLENMLGALGSDVKKDMAGNRLMKTMAKPRKVVAPSEPLPKDAPPLDDRNFWTVLPDGTRLLWWADQDRRERLYLYCAQDIDGERAGGKRLVRLRPSEERLWQLDQTINDRGVFVDETLCRRMKAVVAHVTDKLDREMAVVTDWDVTACSNLNQLKTWIRRKGLETDALDKEAVEELLIRTDLDAPTRRALELRHEAGKASVAKIDALLNGMSKDGFARGLLQFLAANSGRWGGRRFQPQNIRRPSADANPEDAIDIILTHPPAKAAALLEMLYGPALTVISDCLRGMIRAAVGKKLVAADFSNIEGRVLAWLAGETWKIDAFRAYDRGEGPDLYLVTAAEILGVPVTSLTKKSPERQSYGKVPELACGYQGGLSAFQTMAHTYGVEITDEKAVATVKAWRAKHPAIVAYWGDLDRGAFDAVAHPGTTAHVRDTKFRVVGSFLWMQIPSGRAICFPYPSIAWKDMPWPSDDHYYVDLDEAAAVAKFGLLFVEYDAARKMSVVARPVRRQAVSFKGVNSYTRKWETQYLYGGKIANYVTQGTARDVMADAMVRVEAAGYPVILTVHDEVIAEPDSGFGSAEAFEALMIELPQWAAGLPVAAEAWQGTRYRK